MRPVKLPTRDSGQPASATCRAATWASPVRRELLRTVTGADRAAAAPAPAAGEGEGGAAAVGCVAAEAAIDGEAGLDGGAGEVEVLGASASAGPGPPVGRLLSSSRTTMTI